MDKCLTCGRALTRDEVALTRKLVNRGCTSFLCLRCMAARFDATEAQLRDKIQQFKEMGCTLFEENQGE
ncbi:MAG: hypothetical protein PHY12_15045 [Eubacteriales bacterium]|nr:hypothetical protein [Eubacteriales bacterium]